MAKKSFDYSRRHYYRFALLLLIIVPFIPEIIILATEAIARLVGCQPNQKDVCRIGSMAASDVIGWMLQAKAGFIVARAGNPYWLVGLYVTVAAWIVACYAVLLLGWTRMRSRLLLGFAVATIFAILPYFGPMLSLSNLVNENCTPNEGGVGACVIFGGQVGGADYSPAHDAVIMGWLVLVGGPLAFGIFAGYAVGVVFARVRAARRPAASV